MTRRLVPSVAGTTRIPCCERAHWFHVDLLRLTRWLAAAFVALLFVGNNSARAAPPVSAEDNLRLLEVRLEPHVLSEAIPAFAKGKEVLLPLGELANLLTIALTVQPDAGTASGFILANERTFHLDAAALTVTLAGRSAPIEATLVEIHPDDIYVASRLITRWLPVDLDVDLSALRLRVRPREPLPLQQRLEREQRNRPLETQAEFAAADYPRARVPYRFLSVPAIDQTLGVELRRGNDTSTTETFFTSFMTGDLFGMESSAFVSGRQQGDFQKRLTLGRNDPDAQLLGPLRARSFALGSVAMPGVHNIARAASLGTGLSLSSYPLSRPSLFDRHSFQGDLPPGWDIELYHNGTLIGYRQADADGRYRFEDTPLMVGANEFRLVFHGPQGQVREERQSFLLTDSLVAPGEFYYRLAGHESDAGQARAVAQFDWGLARHLSASGGLVTLPVAGAAEQYANLGLRTHWRAMILSGDLAHSGSGGQLGELALKTRLGGVTVGLSQTHLRAFASDEFMWSDDPVSERTQLRLDGSFSFLGSTRLPFSLEMERDRLTSGREEVELVGRLSGYFRGTWMTNQVRTVSSAGTEIVDGALQLGRGFAAFGLRAQANYTFAPSWELTAFALSAERRLALGYMLNAGVTRTLLAPETRYGLGLTKRIGQYGFGIHGAYSTRDELTMGAQLFAALGQEPRTADWVFEGLPMADSGFASVRVFLDENLNGTMDRGETPLQGVGFAVDGGQREMRTDAQGIAYLRRLPTKQRVNLTVDPTTLEDPQWLVQKEGVQFVPRAGRPAELDFSVIMTGEVDGTVFLVRGKHSRPVAGVTLELLTLDPHRTPIRQATTAFDGFYVMESVPPGEYLLRVSPVDLKRLKLSDTGQRLITVSPKGDLINGVEVLLCDAARYATGRR